MSFVETLTGWKSWADFFYTIKDVLADIIGHPFLFVTNPKSFFPTASTWIFILMVLGLLVGMLGGVVMLGLWLKKRYYKPEPQKENPAKVSNEYGLLN